MEKIMLKKIIEFIKWLFKNEKIKELLWTLLIEIIKYVREQRMQQKPEQPNQKSTNQAAN